MSELQTKTIISKAKVVFVGNSSVGKTALFQRFDKKNFSPDTSTTVGGACANISVSLQDPISNASSDDQVPLIVWDTAGQESYRSIVPMYFSRVAFILVVYDITSRSSFESVEGWFKLSKEKAPEWAKIILIGNKADLDETSRKVTFSEGNDLCNKLGGFMFTETSAVTGSGIKDLLVAIATTAKEDAVTKAQLVGAGEIAIGEDDEEEETNGKCC
ncbi:Ras-like GTP-binding protein RYL1 [Tritrichomonas foetus]|uniref:Ras-like GTP-binding protein RYL1 n=1 Tax=Tritrichomonas foetus TaxID=1144522 RepID=A0A1J4JEX2_9EUKA|nr:Ras-like GTP-binding protein RYL1 [Tritrichomonas foetus]|eukprot:OHS97656.1 Ras-like GTP-binding protein RYL1 [Tritrichomonas foetus]